MTEWHPPTTFLVACDVRNTAARLLPSDESAIDAAVTRYAEKGDDTLLHLEWACGGEYCVLASEITNWWLSTPDYRARCRQMDAMLEREADVSEWRESP